MDRENTKKYFVRPWLAPILYFGLKNKAYEFLENLSLFLEAGLSVSEALVSLEQENRSWRMHKVIQHIREDVGEGIMLSRAFENRRFFPESVIEIVKSGEVSGKLVENLKLVVMLNDEERKLKSKLSSSLLYGVIIVSLTTVVAIGTAWFVLPRIAQVYEKMNARLPFLTRALIQVGEFMQAYGNIVVPLFVCMVVILLYFLFSFPKTKFVGHFLLFHLPFAKGLIRESEITRFGYLMGNILEAGLPIHKALHILPGTTTFKNYRKLYIYLEERVSQGIFLAEAMKSYRYVNKLIPPSVLQMVVSAEKSGRLPETFFRISSLYEAKLENTARNLPVIIEPILLLFVGLWVGLFVLAAMLPIYNLSNVIQ